MWPFSFYSTLFNEILKSIFFIFGYSIRLEIIDDETTITYDNTYEYHLTALKLANSNVLNIIDVTPTATGIPINAATTVIKNNSLHTYNADSLSWYPNTFNTAISLNLLKS